MPLLRQAIWEHIWKCTVEKSQTNATNATLHPLRQAIWGHIWKPTEAKSYTNAPSVTMQYASSRSDVLRTHLKTHSGEKSNKCNQCDYACSDPSALRKHLKIHSGTKSNKCNQCDFASLYAGHLRTHLKTHSGEKPNKCNQCDYASSQAGDLRRHLKTHSGEKQANATNVILHLICQINSQNTQRNIFKMNNIDCKIEINMVNDWRWIGKI